MPIRVEKSFYVGHDAMTSNNPQAFYFSNGLSINPAEGFPPGLEYPRDVTNEFVKR